MERPTLDKNLDSKTFRNFYFLKEELVNFCRENGLPTSGGKIEITDRIAHFLDTGEIVSVSREKKATVQIGDIDLNTKIEPNFVCTEKHRAFFKEHIGTTFSFNVAFQKWLKSNTGNTYIRDFFADNQGKSLEEAIKCWKYKKQMQGHNRYERADLIALE